MKNIRYFFEWVLLKIVFFFFGLLNLDRASDIGGRIGRFLGPKLGLSRIAKKNLSTAMPDLNEEEREKILDGMWENLGRLMGEYPHMEQIGKERVEIHGQEVLERLKASKSGSIIFGAHLANWEMTSYGLQELGPCPVVRIPNNPWLRKMIEKRRGAEVIPKSAAGTRQLVRNLKEGKHVGILIDQKYNEGLPVEFLGIQAMTSPAFVQLARKFSCPLVPTRFERLNGPNFRITFYEPLPLNDSNGNPLTDEACIRNAHAYLEAWIRERPKQWIWIHRRWKGIA